MRKTEGFTLIELLIVVAIIAILAAIAVPNFLEAQTRAKVTRMKADMRSAAVAVESYMIDHNKYPFDGVGPGNSPHKPPAFNYWFLPYHISTPIAYMTSANLPDVFRRLPNDPGGHWQLGDARYRNVGSTWGGKYYMPVSIWYDEMQEDLGGWILTSVGPDGFYGPSGDTPIFPGGQAWPTPSGYPAHSQPFDPTNGTTSWGDIHRSQKSSTGYVNTP